MILPLLILLAGPLSGLILQKGFEKNSQKIMGHTIIFSGSFLMGIALFGLLPELYDKIFQAGIWIGVGFFFQIILERFTGGIDHGHIHSNNVPKSVYVLFAGLMLHALFEGYSAGLSYDLKSGIVSGMVVGIAIHEIPAAFSLAVLLRSRVESRLTLTLLLLVYACATPIGYLTGATIRSEDMISEELSRILTAIIAGTFLHISTLIVFENSLRKKEGASKWISIISGLLISYLACSIG